MNKPLVDIDRLSRDERFRLLEDLWESLRRSPADVPLTDEQRGELDRRLDDLEEEGPVGIPWEEVVQRIRGGKA